LATDLRKPRHREIGFARFAGRRKRLLPFRGRSAEVVGLKKDRPSGENVLVEKVAVVNNKYGLHARPAMQFVELAGKFSSAINLVRGDRVVDAKSIMEVLTLGAEPGSQLVIRADGLDADQAVDALLQLVAANFDEE